MWGFEPAGPLDADQEAKLGDFLGKVLNTCDYDKSVPSFVQDTVAGWLDELKNKPEAEAEAEEEVRGDAGGS